MNINLLMKLKSASKIQGKNSKGGIKTKISLIFLIIILIFVISSFFHSWNKNNQINKEIVDLEKNITDLEQDNLEFQELIEYFNSDAYIEEKARVDLGLKKEGEKVVVVTNKQETAKITKPESQKESNPDKFSNPQKWWSHFFK